MTVSISGKRVLVVEDEYLLADDLRDMLEDAGAEVVGPAPDTASALALVGRDAGIDAALLDINLGGTLVFPVADRLTEAAIPFVFATGYDDGVLPERFAAITHLEKPVRQRDVVGAIGALLG